MIKYFLFIFCLFFSSISCFSQEKWSVAKLFKKIDDYYKTSENYSYSSEYFVYESETSDKVVDHYSGISIKKGTINYQKTNTSEFISFDDYYLSINNAEKKVLLSKVTNKNLQSLTGFLKSFEKSKLTQEDKYWICNLWSEKGKSSKQFEKIKIYINKADYSLHKQLFFSVGTQEVEKNKKKILLVNPRLEILFKKNKIIENAILSKENYFTIKNKKISLSKRFKTYKLITL
jgi:hypothetical protein